MNFDYDDDQLLLKDSIHRYLTDNYDFAFRRKVIGEEGSFSDTVWRDAAKLGWLSIPFSEAQGGYGGLAIELMLLFEELGQHLVVEPFLETLVIGGGILRRSPDNDFTREQMAELMGGRRHFALAHQEATTPYGLDLVKTTAERVRSGYSIAGSKAVVYRGPTSELIITSAMLDGRLALFAIPSDALRLDAYPTMDGCRAAELYIDRVTVPTHSLLLHGDAAVQALDETLKDAFLAISAEQVGIMRAALDLTIDYVQQRKQFGLPIGDFQAVQHRLADMYAALELTVSLMYAAAIKSRDHSADAERFVLALRIKAQRAAEAVVRSAFQLHGAIATTDECRIGHYLKRVTVLGQRFGGVSYSFRRYRALRERAG